MRGRNSVLHGVLRAAALCAAIGWVPPVQAADEAAWQLRIADPPSGIRVYLRERDGEVPAFRAVARFPARLSALVAVLLDSERMPEWVYRARRVVRVERQGPTQGVSQVITAMPWPLQDREAIVAWQLAQDESTGTVTLAGRSAPDRLPPSAGLVRMPSFESSWTLVPQADGEVEVRFEGHGDPGGVLSFPPLRMFVDAAVWEAPLYTVEGLREMAARPEYRQAVLPFIREPAH